MRNSHRTASGGFTLIELLIALVIGLLMVGGLIQIFLTNRAAYRVMEGASFMQENMRFAVDRIALSLRMADHWGTVPRSKILGGASGTVCTAGWARDLTRGLVGVDGAAGLPSMFSGCSSIPNPGQNYQQGTDIIMVRYAGPDTVTVLDANQYYVRTGTGKYKGYLYFGGAPDNTPIIEVKQTLIMPYSAELFWVRACSDPGADNICATADDGDTPIPIPTLMRSFLSGNNWTTEAIAEGMEQLQIEYQVMNRQWMNATTVAAMPVLGGGSPWDVVTGARVTGIMRSSQREPGFPADTRTFNLSGDTPAYTVPANAQQFLRTPYEANVVIRNRVRPAPSI